MKIFVGLGNPGTEYENSRHNAGFIFIDALAKKLGTSFLVQKKFKAEVARGSSDLKDLVSLFGKVQAGQRDDIYLIKPQTFMNLSGETVRSFLDYLKLDVKDFESEGHDLIVVHDDLDLKFGQYKLQKGKGPKTHNGLASIYQCLGTKDFWHLRLGVDGRELDNQIPPADYVLKSMSSEEKTIFNEMIAEILRQFF